MIKDIIYVLLIVLNLYTPVVSAQRASVQLQTARLCVSEAGFQITHPMSEYSNDCAAIVGALRNRSRTGLVTLSILRAYTRRLFHGNTRTARQWVSFLWTKAQRPRHWPSNLNWALHRARFLEIYELVGRLLRWEDQPPCNPDHWGAKWRTIQLRALRRGWQRVDCGYTRNDFWTITRSNKGSR